MFGVIGLILGIVGLIGSLVGMIWPISNIITIIALVLAVIGIVMSAIDIKKSEKHGKAVAGLVLGIIAVVIGVIMLIACGGFKSTIGNAVNDLTSNYTAEELANMSQEEQQSIANDLANNLGLEVETTIGQ